MRWCSFRFFPFCFPSARASNYSWALCNLFHTTSPFPLKTFQPPNQTFHQPCPCCHLLCYSHLSGRRAKKSFAKKSFNLFSFKESAAPSCSLHILENICNGKDCQARLSLCNRWALSYDLVLLQKNVFSNRPFCTIWIFCKNNSRWQPSSLQQTRLFLWSGSFAKKIVIGNHCLCNRLGFSSDLDLLQKKLSLATVLFATDRPFPMIWIFCKKNCRHQLSFLRKTGPSGRAGSIAKKKLAGNRPLCKRPALSYDLVLLQKQIVVGNSPLCKQPALLYDLDLLQKQIVMSNRPLCKRPALPDNLDLLQKNLLATVLFAKDRPFHMIWFFCKINCCWRPSPCKAGPFWMIRIFCKKSSLQKNWPLVWTGCCWQPSSLQQIGPFLWSGSFAQKKCYLIPSSLLNAVGLCTKVTGCATNCRFSPFNQEAVTKPKAPFPLLSITTGY